MWPTENDYIKAVTRINPSPFSLLNTKRINIIKDEHDQPLKRTGNNSIVFKVSINEKFYALKCYTKEINNQSHYLSAVQKFVEDISSPFFIPFELHESEVYVIKNENSFHGTYCVLLMPWVEGETLYDYVKKCCKEKNILALEALFQEFQQMAVWFLQQSFVHGDIAAENIMVIKDKKLLLVDYDNILFDGLKFTNGHSPFNTDYQHPKRNHHVVNLAVDHFSLLVLAISLRALQFKPGLFSTYTDESGLLFTASNLREGDKSSVYKELKTIKDPYLQNLLRLLNISTHKQNIEVPLLSTCIVDDDPSSYSRLLEIELEELKKELENSLLHIRALQAEVSKELITKEKLFVENTRLKETIVAIEEDKKKKAALKKSISMAIAGLTCVAVLVGVLFYNTHTKQNNTVAIKADREEKTLPLIANVLPKKDSVANKLEVAESQVIKQEHDSVLKVDAQTEIAEVVNEKKDIPSDNQIVPDNTVTKKSDTDVAGSKHHKTKIAKADYNMFRETGF